MINCVTHPGEAALRDGDQGYSIKSARLNDSFEVPLESIRGTHVDVAV